MGQQQSKEELLHEKAIDGNIEAIKSLRSEGESLEGIDKEGKTPLIVACMDPDRYIVAKTLIKLGANVNAYRPGLHAGTPMHHAAKRGLDHTVRLLLSNGANPFVRNDDCQTPLDVARLRGFTNVVRAIKSHICFFSGWLREFYGPGFHEALALFSRTIWVVLLPRGLHNPVKPPKLELVIYSTLQAAQPRTVVALWKADIEEPKLHQSDPTLIILDKSRRIGYKFASATDYDKQQILSLYIACRGIPQVTTATTASQTAAELAMAISVSIQSAVADRLPLRPNNHPSSEGSTLRLNNHSSSEFNNLNSWDGTPKGTAQNEWGSFGGPPPTEGSSSGWADEPIEEEYNGWGVPQSTPTNNPIQAQTTNTVQVLVPSAPPVPVEGLDEVPIQYPSIDFSPVDFSIPAVDLKESESSEAKDGDNSSSSCVICWDVPVEGACIPCGHMAGCMSCLNKIKTKKGDCPVCRAKINQVIRIYAV